MRRGAAWGCVLPVCLWLGVTSWPGPAQAAPTPEYLIKAAYLYNFALFVEWPADAFPAPSSPLVICVVGADPFEDALDRTIRDKRVGNRAVVGRRLEAAQDLKACHILFVSASDPARATELRSRLDGLPVLLVGETPQFASRGGTINFTIEDNKVKLEVNVEAARRARLNIRANLLKVARIVRGG